MLLVTAADRAQWGLRKTHFTMAQGPRAGEDSTSSSGQGKGLPTQGGAGRTSAPEARPSLFPG